MALSRVGVNIIFACVVCALALTAAASMYLSSDRQHVQKAASAMASGNPLPENHPDIDIAQRITALSQMIAKDPKNPEYRSQIANLYYDSGQYETAADYYRQSLDLRPGDPNVETDLAVCLHYLGQDDRALEALDKVLAHSPGFSQAMFNKGIILVSAKKDIKAGIAIWEKLLRLDPGFAQKAELEQRIKQLRGSLQ